MTSSRAPRITAAADAILDRIGLMKNPYFTALTQGEMPLEVFRLSQEQFFFAVRYFPRPMAAILARMPDPHTRLEILHNIVEEHGDFRREHFHQNTFAEFLSRIGARRPEVDDVPMAAGVHAFNCVLMGTCMADEIDTAVCCLGIIEHAFAGISATIGKSAVERGWIPRVDLIHYTLHAELDVRHAEEFFVIAEPAWNDAPRQAAIRRGLELGAHAFNQLYSSLYMDGLSLASGSSQRQMIRVLAGSSSRA